MHHDADTLPAGQGIGIVIGALAPARCAPQRPVTASWRASFRGARPSPQVRFSVRALLVFRPRRASSPSLFRTGWTRSQTVLASRRCAPCRSVFLHAPVTLVSLCGRSGGASRLRFPKRRGTRFTGVTFFSAPCAGGPLPPLADGQGEMNNERQYLSTREAADYLGLSGSSRPRAAAALGERSAARASRRRCRGCAR